MDPAKLVGSKSFYAAVTSKRENKTFEPIDGQFPELKKADLEIMLPQTVKEGLSLLAHLILIALGNNKTQVIDTNMEKIKKKGEDDGYTCCKEKDGKNGLKTIRINDFGNSHMSFTKTALQTVAVQLIFNLRGYFSSNSKKWIEANVDETKHLKKVIDVIVKWMCNKVPLAKENLFKGE